MRYQGAAPSLDDFVARWLGILEVWTAEKDLSLSRADLQHLLTQILCWFEGGMFQQRQPAPRVFPACKASTPGNAKEQKWGKYKDSVLKKLGVLEGEGWTVAYTDGSAKQVDGWWQAGYGVWFEQNSDRNHAAPVPAPEQQSLSGAELGGVLHALRGRRSGERLVTALDSEYVFKGIIEWSVKWERHGWRSRGKEIGHRDLW